MSYEPNEPRPGPYEPQQSTPPARRSTSALSGILLVCILALLVAGVAGVAVYEDDGEAGGDGDMALPTTTASTVVATTSPTTTSPTAPAVGEVAPIEDAASRRPATATTETTTGPSAGAGGVASAPAAGGSPGAPVDRMPNTGGTWAVLPGLLLLGGGVAARRLARAARPG